MNVKVQGKGESPALEKEAVESYQKQYGWVMLALLWLLYASFGLISRSIFPLVTPILRDLTISYSQMGLILGSWQLTYIVVAVVAGSIIDRWGIRRSLLVGIVIIGLSAALRFFPQGFIAMLLAVAVFGAGGPMISIGCPKTISLWFRGRSRGTAVGVYMTGNLIGGFLALAFTNSLVMPLTGQSWRLTFVCYGLVAFLVGLLWWLLARDSKPEAGSESAPIGTVLRGLVRVRNAQIVLVMAFLGFATSHGLSSWLPKILETSGLSPAVAGYGASIPLATGIPALLVIPRLVPPHLRGRFIALFAVLTIMTLFVVANGSGTLLFVGLSLFGITNSSFLPILVLILMDAPEVGSKHMGSAGGLFFCVAEIGGFAGPLLIGILVDMTGTFLAGAFFLASLNIAIFVLTSLLQTQSGSSRIQ